MRLALISDIHGNLVALEAVLTEIAFQGIEHIICLGDVAASGPQPHEVVARLQQLNFPVIMGNTDERLLQPKPGEKNDLLDQKIYDMDIWCSQQLTETDKAYMHTFQPTLTYPLSDGKTLLCYHGSPRSNRELLQPTTPDADVAQAIAGFDAQFMAGGHTHMQMFRRYRNILLLNPGSVGLAMDRVFPFEEVRNPPWAEYAIITIDDNALNVELRRTPFDIHAFLQITRASGMPHAEWSASEWSTV